ncbi:GPI ethanolamine phosphate transferase 1 isoform X1 [Leptinotarsa decemlineata]|uniref:GPI ethanolamine phosphate transferase 1 isoform X1 n=2 Tax=Leptinotarsa decemlineata TaxID=7539 RepID=UPI003D30B0CF
MDCIDVERLHPEMDEDEDPDAKRTKKYKIILLGLAVHALLLFAVFDVYFASPLDRGMTPIRSTSSPPAKRLVLIVADGLRAEAIFGEDMRYRAPYLNSILKDKGSWGVVHTRVPTESRPGHVAMLAGIYEDPSAILKGWKSNPVYFDSVINQSTNTWAWGSPDILNIFNKDKSQRIHLHSYDSDMEDFGKSDTGALDTWVFQRVNHFLKNEVKRCVLNCTTYFSRGNLFFLHLLGIDTAGHGYKPHSMEYKNNIKLVDENIEKLVALVESVFIDKATAYVFTSDHGMTDWGSHGAGSPHETEAPIIAWGAGLRENNERQDINQTDIAPLLASLIGINIPTNSLGFLPTGYLYVGIRDMSEMVLSNTLQLFEIFKVKSMKIKTSALVFKPFKDISERNLTRKMTALKNLFKTEEFFDLIDECKEFQSFLVEGVNYYHSYYHYPVLISVSLGFMVWIAFLTTTVLTFGKKHIYRKQNNTLSGVLVVLVIYLCYISKFSLTYYLYFTFPFIMYSLSFKNFEFSDISSKISISNLINIIVYVAGIELLVYGFFDRFAFTVIMIILAIWVLIPVSLRVKPSKLEKMMWVICCTVLAFFPTLPVMKTTFNVPMYILGYLGWVAIFTRMYLKEFKVYQRMEGLTVDYKVLLIQFVSLQAAAFYIILLEYDWISPDSFLKYLSWILLILPIIIIPLSSKFIILRLIATFFGFAPFYLLVSPNYEVLFSVFYVALLCIWLIIETKPLHYGDSYNLIYYSKFEDYKGKNKITSDMFRRAFFFTVFIFLGFFGTGNIASLNSFDPMWVRAFLTVFSPFTMMGLILLKFMVPFIFSCSIFRAINSVGKENVLNVFCIILIFSDLMVVQFLYLITNEGSWLDIGTSLSHFIIMEGFVTILLLLYGVAHWLTSISYKI